MVERHGEKPPLGSQSSPKRPPGPAAAARAERLLAERERLSRLSAEMDPAEFRATALATLEQVESLDAELEAVEAARRVLGFR